MRQYTNKKIEELVAEREKLIAKLDAEMEMEIQKERAKYKFSSKRLAFMLFIIIFPIIAYEINEKIFPNTSIWSWNYYIEKFK